MGFAVVYYVHIRPLRAGRMEVILRRPRFVRPLSDGEVQALKERYRRTRDPEERTRCQVILLSQEGKPPAEIAPLVLKSVDTVRRVLGRYEREGLAGLRPRPRPGPRPRVTPAWQEALLEAIERDPRELRVPRAGWTAPLLASYLVQATGIHVGEERVRHYLHAHGYAPRRPTWTVAHLARRDPEYEGKEPRFWTF